MEIEIDSSVETALKNTVLERYLESHNFTLEDVMWYTSGNSSDSIGIVTITDHFEDKFKQYIGTTKPYDSEEDSILRILQHWAKFYAQHYANFIPKK